MDRYVKGPVLGRGTFGEVFKATNKETGREVAIKRIRVGEKGEGVNVTALREARLMRELRHEHVLELVDCFVHRRNICLVFELMETGLDAVIRDQTLVLSPADVKAYLSAILQALRECHRNYIFHRDVKPDNFLIAADGTLKLADFGLAKPFGSPDKPYTHAVFARWYRAPELLYGATVYAAGVDVWAAGCVFAELMLRRPWFPALTDVEALAKIYAALGTPRDPSWAGLRAMPGFVEFEPVAKPPLRDTFAACPAATPDALDLLARMVQLDPRRRITADQALKHRYFRSEPAPTPKHTLPRPHVARKSGAPEAAGGASEAGAEARVSRPTPLAKRTRSPGPADAEGAAAIGGSTRGEGGDERGGEGTASGRPGDLSDPAGTPDGDGPSVAAAKLLGDGLRSLKKQRRALDFESDREEDVDSGG